MTTPTLPDMTSVHLVGLEYELLAMQKAMSRDVLYSSRLRSL